MITVVSGLPRSGTSLMMQILEAGGMQILTDNIRKPDENNQRGYYEYEKVKSLQKDNSWLNEAEGKVIKVIAQLLPYLPSNLNYSIIFVERNIDEVFLSQKKMISNLSGKQSSVSDEILKKTFLSQIEKIKNLLKQSPRVVYVNHRDLLEKGKEIITSLNTSLNLNLDLEAAYSVIDPDLYRAKLF